MGQNPICQCLWVGWLQTLCCCCPLPGSSWPETFSEPATKYTLFVIHTYTSRNAHLGMSTGQYHPRNVESWAHIKNKLHYSNLYIYISKNVISLPWTTGSHYHPRNMKSCITNTIMLNYQLFFAFIICFINWQLYTITSIYGREIHFLANHGYSELIMNIGPCAWHGFLWLYIAQHHHGCVAMQRNNSVHYSNVWSLKFKPHSRTFFMNSPNTAGMSQYKQ